MTFFTSISRRSALALSAMAALGRALGHTC